MRNQTNNTHTHKKKRAGGHRKNRMLVMRGLEIIGGQTEETSIELTASLMC